MSIVKIMPVRSLNKTVNYLLQNYKTEEHLVTTHECSPETIINDFKDTLFLYNEKNKSDKKYRLE